MDNGNFNSMNSQNQYGYSYSDADQQAARSNEIVSKTFIYMLIVLAVSALSAYISATADFMIDFIYGQQYTFIGLIVVELIIVAASNVVIRKNNVKLAALMLGLYSVVNGMTLSVIFFVYELGSIYNIFIVAALMFGSMAAFGFFTKKDLTIVGRLGYMALFGLVIVGFCHMLFFRGQPLGTVYNAIGLTVFIGLTAYDTQKIKEYASANTGHSTNTIAMYGALILYLDFINIFLKLLALFGRRK